MSRRSRRDPKPQDDRDRWATRALASVPEGVVTVDLEGRITYANHAAVNLLGWAAGDLQGLDLHETLCHSHLDGSPRDRNECPAHATLRHGAVHRGRDDVLWRRDGGAVPVELSCGPLAGAEGALGAVVSFRDVSVSGRATDYYGEVLRLTERDRAQREVVRQLQEAVSPRMPRVAGVDLGVFELAADPSEPSGGDLYDWVVLPDGDLHLVIVDVMGKGVAATKDALAIVHALRVLVFEGCPMENLVTRADQLLLAHDPNLVATLVVGRYTPATGRLRLAGGGHPPLFLVGADGAVREVAAPGIPIGWPDAGSFEIVDLIVERSETVLLYTDGLIEARRDIVAGLSDLRAAVGETAGYPARHLPRILVERALAGAQRSDDTLAMVLRRRAAPASAPHRMLGPFEHRFSPSMAAVPVARHLFADWMTGQGVEEGDHADLLIVASELCSNAVRMASGAPRGVVLRASAEGSALVLEVEDDGVGFQSALPMSEEIPALDQNDGRGLFIVQSMVDELDVRTASGGTVVRCVKRCLFAEPDLVSDPSHRARS
ncbi:MAG: SpoIIE family protein phosphatase [Acidimicrobiales bacterium]